MDTVENKTNNSDTPWYQAAFDDLYPLLYRHRDDNSAQQEADALIRLFALRSNRGSDISARVLDVCCGAGRHAAAFARAGFDVWGTDLSPRLLADAARRPELAGRIAQSDIRALPFRPAFDIVLNLFTSFGYFPTDEENSQALRELARTLNPGGRLILDHMNRPQVERTLVPEDTMSRHGMVFHQRRRIDKNRILKKIDVTDAMGRRASLLENVRLYAPGEMTDLFRSAGLEDIHLYGDFAGADLAPESPRMIATGVKPGP